MHKILARGKQVFNNKHKKQPVEANVQWFIGSRKRSIKALPSDTIVCDVGSAMTRMGFANNKTPQVQIPSFIAHHNRDPGPVKEGFDGKPNFCVGDEAKKHRHNSQPIQRGAIEDVDSTVLIMEHGFYRIKALSKNVEDLSGRNLLLALRFSVTTSKKEELFQTLMETYGMDGCYFALQQPLILYATGRLTGLVVDSGEEITHVVPVYEGEPLLDAIETVNMGGRTVTDRLASYLTPHGFHMQSLGEIDYVNKMKIKMAFVSRSRAGGGMHVSGKRYRLPDGKRIVLQDERYLCAEPLFNPDDVGLNSQGMATAVTDALNKCPLYFRNEIADNIVPCGGNSVLKGFDERLQLEVNRIVQGDLPVVRSLPAATKLTACWTGGAVLAHYPTFKNMLVTKAEFDEEGIRAFQKKCVSD